MTQADQYVFWRGALKENYPYPMQDGMFECGFWRTKNRDKSWSAVAIWKDGDDLKILVNNTLVDPEKFAGRWNYTWTNPVTKEAYDEFRQTGLWPGEVAGIGDNAPPDEYEELKENIADKVSEVEKWLQDIKEINDQNSADKAANHRDYLNRLAKRAEDVRTEIVRPLNDEVKAVNGKFSSIRDSAKNMADRLRSVLTKFLIKQEEEENKRREEEQAKLNAERMALEDQDIALAVATPVEVALPPKRATAGGQFGKKASLRTAKRAEIEDLDEVFAFFKGNEQVLALLQKLANQVARSGGTVPGARLVEEKAAS